MTLAYVLAGGGLKAAYQAGVIAGLEQHHGIRADLVYGVSAGAINALSTAQRRRPADLERRWTTIRAEDIHRTRSWWKLPARLLGSPGVYDHEPLYRMLIQEVQQAPLRIPCRVGFVDLVTGDYRSVDISEPGLPARTAAWYVQASCTMPIWPPIGGHLVDGGVRHVTPLGEVLDSDATHVVVILCSPEHGVEVEGPPRNNIEYGLRCLEIAMAELAHQDIAHTLRVNELVGQAAAAGAALRKPSGRPYRHIEITLYAPPEPLGGTLDDDPAVLVRRWEMGWEHARRHPFSTSTPEA